ncbi:hypothetical protein KZZ52_40815 [Dactylosporangium sp. AC04546]|uniref:hypothetical protein n=1 Tax=Dactylosporangium sp. AC04546 TaxID=2862460 RepID=UPI001EDEA5B7|nr:hypothetical protein [Dactylosporangium sp. AC04546]WVK80287.1 hypothetical protein KZZ52_40815 [Dactylosporangium sp. AC04546]
MRNGWAWAIAVTVVGGWTVAAVLLVVALLHVPLLTQPTRAEQYHLLFALLGAQLVGVATPAAAAWMAARQGWRAVAWTFGGLATGFAAVGACWDLLQATA